MNKRDLPWRGINDPYKIWISEIILQQTRVVQGLDYYNRFIERFPDVTRLALAEEEEVLKCWQGLGYYSRARNLHNASKTIITKFGGQFPKTYEEVLTLSGVGEYTAAAITSFAYNLPYAAIDGNIYRVLARIFAVDTPIDSAEGKKQFRRLADLLMDEKSPGLHNQAIMEFGALQCIPQKPDCSNCPLNVHCESYKLNIAHQLPVKQGKTKVSNRYFNYFFIINGDYTYLKKRTDKDIWQNLYEFPLIETNHLPDFTEMTQSKDFRRIFSESHPTIKDSRVQRKHMLSHRTIHAVFYTVSINSENDFIRHLNRVSLKEITHYPISRLTEVFLENVDNR